MKVVWVMKEFGIGGAERLLLELARRLPDVEFVPVAVSIEEVLSDKDLTHHLAAAGSELVETTSHLELTVTSLREVYEKASAR